MSKIDDLANLKESLDKVSRRVERKKGERDNVLKQLKDKHGIKNVKDVDKNLERIKADVAKLKVQLEKHWRKLSESGLFKTS